MIFNRILSSVIAVASMAIASVSLAQLPARLGVHVLLADSLAPRYLAVAESAATFPKARATWQKRIDTAHDTLDAALSWYQARARSDEELRMLVALSRFWNGPSLVAWFDSGLALPNTRPAIRARALNSAAAAAFRIKDRDRTRRWAYESIAISRSLGDSSGMGRAYERLVQVALRDGDHAMLRAFADTGSRLCVSVHDEDCEAYLLNMRGESARVLKQYDSAAVYYDRAGTIYARISPAPRLTIAHNMGFTLLAAGRIADARQRFINGLRAAVAVQDKPYYAYLFAGLASADAAERNPLGAAKLFGMSDAILEQLGIVADPADAVEYERYRSLARTQMGAKAFDAAVKAGRATSVDLYLAGIK